MLPNPQNGTKLSLLVYITKRFFFSIVKELLNVEVEIQFTIGGKPQPYSKLEK